MFFTLRHFLLFRPRIFPRALGSVAHRKPARTPYANLGPGRGPWHALWGLKVARPFGEAFRARKAIQVHANQRTGEKNVRRDAHVCQNYAGASHWMSAHPSCSCSSARARARVFSCSCPCSSTRVLVSARVLECSSCPSVGAQVLVVLVLECSSTQVHDCS